MFSLGVGATPTTFGTGNSTWESDGNGTFTVTLKAAGDLKSMEQTWDYGKATPWVVGSKLILVIDENVTQEVFQQIVGNNELYLLCQVPNSSQVPTAISTLDLSNLNAEQAAYLNPNNQWPSQWQNVWDCNLTNIIVPSSYATSPQTYAKAGINSVGKSGSTLYFFKQSSKTVTWTDIRDGETTLKLIGEYSNNFSISDATAFTTIDITSTTYTETWVKVTVPTVGADGVALTKILVSDATMQGRVLPTDAATTAAIEVSGSGSGGSGEGGDDPDPTTLAGKIALRMQLTDAPTIYIDLPDIGNSTLGEYLYKKSGKGAKYDDAPYRRASIKVVATDDTTSPHYMESFEEDADHLEIKVRGNSTALEGSNNTQGKRAYRLKFAKKDKTTGKNFKHDMINGGYSKRNWALLANVMDHSMLRNAVTCELGKIVGMPFNPGYKFVDLVINNDYRGTYQITDHPEVDGDRININEDTGWYVEFQGQTNMCDFPMFVSSPYFINIKNPEPAYTGTETTRADSLVAENVIKEPVTAWFGQNGWQKGFGKNFTNPTLGWRAYNDEETLMNWWIVTEITGDYDGMMTVKAYREADGKLHWGPVWDKDLAYGNYNGSNMGTATGSLVKDCSNSTAYMKSIFEKFAADPEFMLKVKTKMDALVAAGLKTTLCNNIDELATNIAGTEALNYGKWGYTSPQAGVDEQYHAGVAGYDNYAAYITQLKNWINDRVDYVQTQFTSLSNTANEVQDGTVVYDVTKTSNENANLTNGIYKEANTDKYINVTLTGRSFAANEWSAISLPFSVDETQMKTIFGTSYDIKTFTGVSDDGTKMIFETPDDKSVKAGMPYIIKPSQAVADNTTFNKVIFSCYEYWNSTVKPDGESITFGDYTLTSKIYKGTISGKKLIGTDGKTLSASGENSEYNGSIVYVTVAEGASAPTIQFGRDVRTQLTTLPTIYVDTQDKAEVQPSSGEWVAAGIQVIDAKGNLKPFTQEIGLTAAGKNILQIRGRGTTSWTNTDKKSYRLQFGKDDKDESGNVTTSYKHNLLVNEDGEGVVKKRNWVLLANSGDKTLVRNALTKEIGDAVGLPFTPGYRFVDLVLNGTYVGTYQVTEFLEADANRVNIDEDNGLLIQMTGSADADLTNDHVISGTDYTKPYLTIKNPEIKAKNQTAWNAAFNTDVYNFDGMWAANDGTGLNKESLVNWYIASEIIGDYEALSSIYAFKDVNATELSFGPLWGTETAYDNSTSINMTSAGLMNDLNDNTTHTGLMTQAGKESAWKTKIEGLWAQPWFANAVRLRWNTLYNNGALTTTLKDRVTTLAGIVNATDETFTTSSQAKNYTSAADGGAGWTIAGQGITDYSKSVANEATFTSEVERLQGYFDTRLPYLDKKFKAMDNTVEYDVTRSDALTYYAPYNTLTTNVTLKNRGTITSSYWNPIAFPFSATEAQMQGVFGDNFELEQFSNVESQGDKVSVLRFTAVSTKAVTAGTPYLIKPVADVNLDEKIFSGVTFNSSEECSTTPSSSYSYVALLQPQTFSADKTHLFVGKNNTFVRLKGSATLTGARAYFTIPEAAYSKQFTFGGFDDVTGISNVIIQTDADNSKIYNLNGQMVGTNWNTLPQGVYIVNGKKIVK